MGEEGYEPPIRKTRLCHQATRLLASQEQELNYIIQEGTGGGEGKDKLAIPIVENTDKQALRCLQKGVSIVSENKLIHLQKQSVPFNPQI